MMNKVEFKLDNGDKCFVYIRFNDLYKQLVIDGIDFIPKGKRNKESYNFNDDYAFRKLDTFEDRYRFKLQKYLQHPHLTVDHLQDALDQTWNSLRPKIDVVLNPPAAIVEE
ncbi:hypothetical protein EHV15_35960 [Paenibacillus oralis]|uniref:Uncharacterized protein n=1 Tax=Paenibacillus oralis TaxID=2490856 RepID=A0A3P3TAD2_9BACL|nr:hypothetical protein [Paenibacillus oralis]RRJ54967.1 hypothetical protein EHV15_35960 [Paenibacillus oralis]